MCIHTSVCRAANRLIISHLTISYWIFFISNETLLAVEHDYSVPVWQIKSQRLSLQSWRFAWYLSIFKTRCNECQIIFSVCLTKWWSGLLSCVLLACDWKDTVHVRKLSFITSFFFHVRLSINKQNLLHLYMSQGTQLYVVYLYERTVTLKNLIIKMLTCNIHAILLSPSLYSDLVVLSQRNTHIFSSSFIISPCSPLKP